MHCFQDWNKKHFIRLTLCLSLYFQCINATDDWRFMNFLEESIENDFLQERVQISPICQYDSPDLVLTNNICDIRGVRIPELAFRWRATLSCFEYLQPSLINSSQPNVKVNICNFRNKILNARCLMINTTSGNELCYQVDLDIPEVVQEIRSKLISDVGLRKWMQCTRNALKCCENVLAPAVPEEQTCAETWDGWTCWNKEEAGRISQEVCPEYAYSNTGPACHHFSQKECFSNATWNIQSNYASCSITPRIIARNNFHIICLSISIAIAFPAVVIFFSYKKLRVRKLALHRNLLIAVIIRNILVIITKSTIVLEELTVSGDTAMSRNEWPCKLLSFLDKLASSAAFTCMLIDGFYLHRMIVNVFKKELRMGIVYGIGAAATIVPVMIWMILMLTMNDTACWIVYTVPNIQWVLDTPRLLMLFINVVLLVDIMRVLFVKLRRSENSHNLSTAKATIFLMPLFGVQFLLTAWRPNTTSCDLEQAYYFFTYIMDGLQGIMIALLYCYCNREVHNLIKITYRKTETIVSTRFKSEGIRRFTEKTLGNRRDTTMTAFESQQRPSNRPFEISEENNELSVENEKTFTTFKPEEKAVKENDEDVEVRPNERTVNSIALLKNPYSGSQDGFIRLEFENDLYEGSYDNLRRLSEIESMNTDSKDENNATEIKPRLLRGQGVPQNDYANFQVIMKHAQNGQHKPSQTDEDINDPNNNSKKYENPDDVVFLNRAIPKTNTDVLLPDLCNGIDDSYLDEDYNKLDFSEKCADNVIEKPTNLSPVNKDPSYCDEFEEMEDIDVDEIFAEVNKRYENQIFENPAFTPQDDSNQIYEEVVLDPQKLCPNRSDNDDIVFV